MKAHELGAHVSHVAGLDSTHTPTPDPDPDRPADNPHASHTWVLCDRWAVCEVCGVRDHWPGAELACGKVPPATTSVPRADALEILREDLIAFGSWAERKGLDDRPTIADWRAEVFEWCRVPGGRL